MSMSSHLGLSVLAEGVEFQEEKALLHKIGCKRYQGYYFSKPLDVNKATQCLGEKVRFPL